MCCRTSCMDDSLRDALMVKAVDLFSVDMILEQMRSGLLVTGNLEPVVSICDTVAEVRGDGLARGKLAHVSLEVPDLCGLCLEVTGVGIVEGIIGSLLGFLKAVLDSFLHGGVKRGLVCEVW